MAGRLANWWPWAAWAPPAAPAAAAPRRVSRPAAVPGAPRWPPAAAEALGDVWVKQCHVYHCFKLGGLPNLNL